jgi:hypothetical protein
MSPFAPPAASYVASDASSTRSAQSRFTDAFPSSFKRARFTASSSRSAFRSDSRALPGMTHSSSSMHPGRVISSWTPFSTQKPYRNSNSSLFLSP